MWNQMTEQERFNCLKAMEIYGGGFASRLAEAWQWADSSNSKKLAEAFPGLIAKYSTGEWKI